MLCIVSINLIHLTHTSALVLFQMALIPLTMSRYTIAALSSSRLNYYLPLDKSLRIHIYLGYTMVSISIMALIIFFVFLGLLCSEGDEASCDKLGSEIMITGYCIAGLLVSTMFWSTDIISSKANLYYSLLYRHSWLERRTIVTQYPTKSSIEFISPSW